MDTLGLQNLDETNSASFKEILQSLSLSSKLYFRKKGGKLIFFFFKQLGLERQAVRHSALHSPAKSGHLSSANRI